jgi:ATP-binding cassette subfamily G (WHITE) protein 2 (SNQ2)
MMALSPDLGFAGNVLVFLVCVCNWFNGIIVPFDQIQVFWRYWVSKYRSQEIKIAVLISA